MRHTAWVMLVILVVTGAVLPGTAHDGCADTEGEHEGLTCGAIMAPGTVVIPADAPFESPVRAQLPASVFGPLDHPPKSDRLSA